MKFAFLHHQGNWLKQIVAHWRRRQCSFGSACLLLVFAFSACSSQPSTPPVLAPTSSTEWPMEGQSPQRSRVSTDDIQLPLNAQAEYKVVGDAEHASPIAIAGGRFFAETDRVLHAVALDNGQEQWQFNFAGSFLSPAVVNNTVYVRSETGEDGFIYALTADTGAKLWLYKFAKVGSGFDNVGGHVTSPVVVDGLVLVGAAKEFHALDAQTGKERWKFATQYPIVSSASVMDGIAYFSDFTRLYAVDLKTGQERWRFDHGKLALFFAPIILDNQVAIAGRDTIYLLDRTTGKQLWSRSFDNATMIPAGFSTQHLYVKSTNQLFALNRQDGKTAWDFNTTNFISLPAIAQNQLYVIIRSDNGSQVLALQQSDGKELWHVDQAGLASAAPVIAGGRLYVREATGNVLVFRSS